MHSLYCILQGKARWKSVVRSTATRNELYQSLHRHWKHFEFGGGGGTVVAWQSLSGHGGGGFPPHEGQ